MQKTHEIKEGINGSGKPVFLVYVMQGASCIWVHYFATMAEAKNWVKWC